jgi:SAM-dependent methyltransferase
MDGTRARILAAFDGVEEVEEGILGARSRVTFEASELWSSMARENPISAAAASSSSDPFVKYPSWIGEYVDPQHELALDAGCGYGRVSIPLLEQSSRLALVGVDISLVMLREYLRLARRHGVADRIVLYHGGLTRLPLHEATFDCVLSAAVLLHLPRSETRRVLQELHRILRPGGRLILASCFPNLANVEGLQSWLYERLLRDPARNGPVRAYTRAQVRQLFEGWREVQIIERGATLFPRQLFGIALPGGTAIRDLNQRAEGQLPGWVVRRGWVLSQHDVVATK